MDYKIKDLENGEKEIKVIVSVKEQEPYLEKASKELSKRDIKGFRPGKAPRSAVEAKFGAMAVLQQALDDIVRITYGKILQDEKLKVVGSPEVNFDKQVPGEDLEYVAKVVMLPEVKLGNIKEIKISRQEEKVKEDDIKAVLEDLQKMRVVEKASNDKAKKGDKVFIDFEVKVDGVVIDGGSAKNYPLVLGDNMFIPGFEDQLIGLKKGDKKQFKLNFPDNYQKNLKGKQGDFSVVVNNILHREFPPIDDNLAKQAGNYKSLEELKKQVKENISADKKIKADKKFEIDVLEKLVELSNFSHIPEILIKNEIHKMTHELSETLSAQNTTLEQYLQRIDKSKKDIEQDWREPAIKRVKVALVARQLAEQENISASAEEIKKEKEIISKNYANNPEIQKNLDSPDFYEYLFHTLTNRKVVKFLKDKVLSENQ